MVLSLIKERIKKKRETGGGKTTLFFKSFAEATLDRLSSFIAEKRADKNIIGLIHAANLPAILFSYGSEFSGQLIDKIILIIAAGFQEEVYIERITPDCLMFCVRNSTIEKVKQNLSKIFEELRIFKDQTPEKPIYLCLYAGIELFTPGKSLDEALNQAYIALFESKSHGASKISSYDEVPDKMLQHENQLKLAAYFQRAIIEKRLRLAFQPIIDSKTGKSKHHECLLRIVTEDGKIISAGPFIPIAEAMGFIDQIDSLVLDLVVNELNFNSEVNLAMNVSNLSIDNVEWLTKAKSLLKDSAIATRLTIEITETSMHKDLTKVAHFVDIMQGIGCLVAIDDFGSGYTSFTQLKMIHADLIKIDGIFIRDIVDNHDSRLFVQTLLEFAKGFGIKTVAEFVETGEIAKTLIALDIDYMQGNYFSPAVNYRTWVKEDACKLH